MTGCRISKVTYKNSPHLHEIVPEVRGGDFPVTMHKHVDELTSQYEDGMAGYVIVCWDFKGQYNAIRNIHQDSFIGTKALPSFISDILRTYVMEDVSRNVMEGNI